MHTCVCVHACVPVRMCVCVRVCVHVCVCVCVCACIYMHAFVSVCADMGAHMFVYLWCVFDTCACGSGLCQHDPLCAWTLKFTSLCACYLVIQGM